MVADEHVPISRLVSFSSMQQQKRRVVLVRRGAVRLVMGVVIRFRVRWLDDKNVEGDIAITWQMQAVPQAMR